MSQSSGEIDDEKHRQRILERIDFSVSQAPAISDPGTADDAAATGAGGGGGGGAGVGGGNGGISYFERIMLKKNRRQVNGTTSTVIAGEGGVCVDGDNTPQNTSHNSTTLEVTHVPRVYTVCVLCSVECSTPSQPALNIAISLFCSYVIHTSGVLHKHPPHKPSLHPLPSVL